MIGQYFVLDKMLELCEQGRLSASQILKFQAPSICQVIVEFVFLSG
jgi:hypothetical protein